LSNVADLKYPSAFGVPVRDDSVRILPKFLATETSVLDYIVQRYLCDPMYSCFDIIRRVTARHINIRHTTTAYTAHCICISGFWGLRPQTPTGALPWTPRWGLPSNRPSVPTLLLNPGYATSAIHGDIKITKT